ncbi:O-antigen ligase family protein [Priestia megaterium]|uniref:O-antigen ligase family protein n=1 Tax=Priestia megaterium TaxID=1404 RepID=UPI0023DB6E45|nr:O-antigen ligase family protein [Priestia megaterium]MDF2056292.1 O-antigen ligase family protein [Priestia megaterium]MDF2060254.1 O-antigen ligase family protein [Priestia megaterium]
MTIFLRKDIYIYMITGLIMGIIVPFLGIYSLGLIAVALGLYVFYKIQLNGKTASILVVALLYANFLRPIGGSKFILLAVDIFIFCVIIKHVFIVGIKKEKLLLLGIVSCFVFLSFVQMFNPNIPSFMAGFEGFRKTSFALLLFYLGALAFNDAKEARRFFVVLSLFSTPVLLYGIKQYLFLSNFDMLYIGANDADIYTGMLFGKPRATSIFAGPFHFGMFGAVLAVVNLFLMDTAKRRGHKFWFFILLAISLFGCYSSLTRTNLVALFIALISYKILANIKRFVFVFPIISVILIFSMNYIISVSDKLIYSTNGLLRMIGTISNFSNDTRLQGRTHGWEVIQGLVKEHPIVAYGTGSAGDTLQNTYAFQYHATSHNYFLKLLMETGVIGFLLIVILFIALIGLMLKKIFNETNKLNKRLIVCSLSVFSIFLVNTMVNSTIETYPVSGLIFLILGIALIKFKKDEAEEDTSLLKS